MSPLLQEVQDLVNMVFQRYPTLCGFSVREDMSFSNLACYPALAGDEAQQLLSTLGA